MSKEIIKLVSTFFYLGYSALIPGTIGSLGGLGLYFILRNNSIVYTLVMVIFIVLGFAISGKAEEIFNKKDSRKIVIDEVAGVFIALFLLPPRLPVILSAFLVFRALDAIKAPPADRLQKLGGSLGIMLDDIVAGIYTNICLQVALRLV
jgi:phosphatidylglycerophosphatase A